MQHCLEPGCASVVSKGRCVNHDREVARVNGTAFQRGYDRAWRRLRAYKLQINPLCERCAAHGCTEAAREVHHRVTIEDAPDRRLDLSNLEALCIVCHRLEGAARRSQREGQ